MYKNTHSGTARIEWPDGGCYLGQTWLLIEVWDVIRDELVKAREQ